MTNSRALIAMSGGVDSSVAAYLTKNAGYEVIGATMQLYDGSDAGTEPLTCSQNDVEDARRVADMLNIPFYILDFKEDFRTKVIENFIKGYEAGITPNPCIDCNRYIKFDLMQKFAEEKEQDFIITGHYARIEYDSGSGRFLLKRSIDKRKDQSYVLFSLSQKQLAHTQFPLGEMSKEETREIAELQGFENAHKRESQDICFIPDGDYAAYISRYTGKDYPEGSFVYKDGTILGRHRGIIRYTIGQRKGLGLSLTHPMYVCDKDMENNTIILGENEDLFSRSMEVYNFNWIACETPKSDIRAEVKIRYGQKANPARIIPLDAGRVKIEFEEAQRAVTKGQAAVLYDGDVVIGGGTIM